MSSLAQTRPEYYFRHRFDPHRYSENYLIRQLTEAQVQDAIIAELEFWKVDVIAIDAGMKRARGRILSSAKQLGISAGAAIAKFTAGGLPAGWPDLHATLAPDGVALYVEVKAPAWIDPKTKRIISEAGKPSKEQLFYLDSKHRRGAIVCVAWSVEDVLLVLGDRLENNRASLSR
jgi:hypothetical protein